ncbi:hypothetical protein AB0D04_30430 [Streptomyces sp. NPDC048483]|uniref:hypothetical protein n=1 Tax=Streptomyces sp. NPDC048483 TaxID=3154927 RepID=UPI0034125078
MRHEAVFVSLKQGESLCGRQARGEAVVRQALQTYRGGPDLGLGVDDLEIGVVHFDVAGDRDRVPEREPCCLTATDTQCDTARVAELSLDEGEPAGDLGSGESDAAFGLETARVESGPDREVGGVEGVTCLVLDVGVFEIKSALYPGGSEADLAVSHQFGCPDVVADGGLAELEDAAAVGAEAGAVEEDSAGDLGAAQLDAPGDTAVGEPDFVIDAYGGGHEGGEAGRAEVEPAGLRSVEVRGVLEVAGGEAEGVGYLCVLEVQEAGDPGASEAEGGHLAEFGRVAEEEGADDLGTDRALGTPGAGLFGVLVLGLAEVDRFTAGECLTQAAFQRGQFQDLHLRDITP